MTERGPAGGARSVDGDGVVRVELAGGGRRRLWPLVLALPALAGLAFLFATSGRTPRAPSLPAPVAPVARAPEAPEAPTPRRAPAVVEPVAPEAGPEAAPEAGGEPSAAPRPTEGVYAFPPPGTKRIKAGIVVPEGFALPPGYMRHYQTTDKGEMLKAILVFHPDHRPVDAAGRAVPLPADRVVPPEMAPPGLAIETLEVPADAYADPEKERADAER